MGPALDGPVDCYIGPQCFQAVVLHYIACVSSIFSILQESP